MINQNTQKCQFCFSGHGFDNNGCCEFAPTSHHFLINGKYDNVLSFDQAGTPTGCADVVSEGGIPNEHGTWLCEKKKKLRFFVFWNGSP